MSAGGARTRPRPERAIDARKQASTAKMAAVSKVVKLLGRSGAPITRADVEAFKAKIDTMVARATGLVRQGVPKDKLMAQLKTEDLGWQLSFTGDQLDSFYADLAKTK